MYFWIKNIGKGMVKSKRFSFLIVFTEGSGTKLIIERGWGWGGSWFRAKVILSPRDSLFQAQLHPLSDLDSTEPSFSSRSLQGGALWGKGHFFFQNTEQVLISSIKIKWEYFISSISSQDSSKNSVVSSFLFLNAMISIHLINRKEQFELIRKHTHRFFGLCFLFPPP